MASQKAANPKLAFQAHADRVDAVNNDQLTAMGKHLTEAEDMENTRGLMFATAGGIYAAERLPFGPLGNAIGGAAAAGGIYLLNKVAPNDVEAEGKELVHDSTLKSPRDIMRDGHVAGHAVGLALDKDGNASTIYRFETGETDKDGHKLTAYGVWKEDKGEFMQITGMDFGDKKPGMPAGANYSGGTEWKTGHEPSRR